MLKINYTTEQELENDFAQYADIALGGGYTGDLSQLRGLLNHYRKQDKPFTAFTNDHRAHFGDQTEKYAGVIKELIDGYVHWKNQKKTNLNPETLTNLYELNLPDGFTYALSEWDMSKGLRMPDGLMPIEDETVDLSESGVMAEVYLTGTGAVEEINGLIYKTIAKEGTWKYSPGPGQAPVPKPLTFISTGTSDKDTLTVSIEELKKNFDENAKQYITVPLTHDDRVMDNTGFVREMLIDTDENGKTILRAGIEFTEPDVKEKVKRGSIADISSGIHFDYIKKDDGSKYNAVVGHTALTNHPWLNGMKSYEVNAAEDLEILAFSEEEKEDNNPQMPKEVTKLEVTDEVKAPEIVEVPPAFLSEMGISEDEAKARLAEYASLKAEQKKNVVADRCRNWQEEGVTPALVLAAEAILEADEGVAILNLSEDGKTTTLTASDIVDRLIAASPRLELSGPGVTDELVKGEAPPLDTGDENEFAKLSLEERSLAFRLVTEQFMTTDEAIKEAKARLTKDD